MQTDRNPHIQFLPDAGVGCPRFALADLSIQDMRVIRDALDLYAFHAGESQPEEVKQAMHRLYRLTAVGISTAKLDAQ